MNSEGVLSHLFSFVGRGHFLYVAPVPRSWRTYYTPKAGAIRGKYLTTFNDGLTTISCLKYAFANDVEFTENFHPEKDDFGRGVYKWARQHGFPLYVWVTQKEYFDDDLGKFRNDIIGVFSTLGKAKEAALEDHISGFDEDDLVEVDYDWSLSADGSFSPDIIDEDGCHTYAVKPFVVDELAYADETSPLLLYVTCRTRRHFVAFADEDDYFIIDGVFATKELANKSLQSMVIRHERPLLSKKDDLLSYTIHGKLINTEMVSTYATEWQGYLDGEGGKPGNIK